MTAAVLSTALVAVIVLLVTAHRRPVRAVTGADIASSPLLAVPATDVRARFVLRRRAPRHVTPGAVATWADDLARSLRHGSTLHEALSTVIPHDPVVERGTRALRHHLARGTTVADACTRWADSLPATRVGRVELLATTSTVVGAAALLGGSAAAPLDRLAVAMRQHASSDLERSAQSAQARMSARVLTFVPLVVLGLLVVTDHDVRSVITQARGFGVVTAGLGLNTLGSLWMRRIVGHHESAVTP